MTPANEDFVKHLLDHMQDWFDDAQSFQLARLGSKYYPYTHLFSPVQVNAVRIKNRIVMGPMGNFEMAEEFGRPNDKMIEYFTERARGGVGLITTGLIPISDAADPTLTEKGGQTFLPRISRSRTVFSGWRDLAENVHSYGTHVFIQLTPGMGRVGPPDSLLTKHKLPVSASWNPNYYAPGIPCRPLTDGECKRIIKDAGQACADAKAMNIDGAYLHGHEGYLLEQMANPAFNRRVLSHFADWPMFGLEMVREIRKRVGPEYPIMYRIDLSLALNATYGARMAQVGSLKKFRGERQIGETLQYMADLVAEGVDLFDVDLGCYENWWLPHPPNSMPSGVFLPVSRLVKEYFAEHKVLSNAGLPVPVVGVGKLGYPDLAEKALRDQMCDMIMLARPLLADPDWPNKAYAGRVDEICPCIGDQEACLNELPQGGHLKCSVNPRTGLEDVIARDLTATAKPRKIGIVGAGPGGITAAITAARRGHHVTLYEARERVGGWLVPGSVPKIKYEIGNYLAYLEGQLARCIGEHRLALQLKATVTPGSLADQKLDILVVCSGAKPVRPKVEGADLPHVVQAVDLFLHPQWAQDAGDVVVVGGGAVGCEAAHWLSSEYGKRVTLVEMQPSLMTGACTANRGHMIHSLERHGVKLLNCTRVTSIRAGQVTIARNVSSTVPDPFVTWTPLLPANVPNPLARPIREEIAEEVLAADLVVLAAGLHADHTLFEACEAQRSAKEIYAIGDNFRVGHVFDAVHAGFRIGSTL